MSMPSYYRKAGPDDHPALFSGETVEDPGWELLVSPEDKKVKYHFTAERVAQDQERYRAVIECLGMNMPARLIAKAFKVHHRVVAAIIIREKTSIDALKKDLGELMLKASGLAVQEFIGHLAAGNVDPKTAAIAAGIFAQNGSLLTGSPTAIIGQEKPSLTIEAVNGFWERINRLKSAAPQGAFPDGSEAIPALPAPAALPAPSDAESTDSKVGGGQ